MARRVQQNHQHGGFVVLLLINYTQMAFAPVEVFSWFSSNFTHLLPFRYQGCFNYILRYIDVKAQRS
jgi:hypothetical protein